VLAFLGEIFARHPIMSNTSTTHEFSRTTEPLFKETSMAILTMPHPTMGQSLPTAIILVLGDPTMMNTSVGLLEDEVTPFLHVRFAMVMKYIKILTLTPLAVDEGAEQISRTRGLAGKLLLLRH
jgi:hypothetical protein